MFKRSEYNDLREYVNLFCVYVLLLQPITVFIRLLIYIIINNK